MTEENHALLPLLEKFADSSAFIDFINRKSSDFLIGSQKKIEHLAKKMEISEREEMCLQIETRILIAKFLLAQRTQWLDRKRIKLDTADGMDNIEQLKQGYVDMFMLKQSTEMLFMKEKIKRELKTIIKLMKNYYLEVESVKKYFQLQSWIDGIDQSSKDTIVKFIDLVEKFVLQKLETRLSQNNIYVLLDTKNFA